MPEKMNVTPLESFPPVEKWDDWTELDPTEWPKRKERRYTLVPTTCFNCEAACGLMAFVDKETLKVKRFDGNPYHPGSRGKNCAKGPATLAQVNVPGRILHPLKRVGPRGSGKFERTTWNEVLDVFAKQIRDAITGGRRNEVMYHVGRPGEDGFVQGVLKGWGVDAHNSHTNVCSSGARFGYAIWCGADRPSPDHENAKFILMLSAHLETGHYFNPHAQRITEGKRHGAKICVVDVRHSNTASKADYWFAPWPGTEATLILAIVNIVLKEDLFDREFVRNWVNWRDYLRAKVPGAQGDDFDAFVTDLKERYKEYTPERAAQECGVSADMVRDVAREVGEAGSALAAHVWRNTAAGNLGGWQVSRCLHFLVTLMGAVGAKGGTNLNSDNKFVPKSFRQPPPQGEWNELLYPLEYPLAYHELSYLLPHLLEEGRGKIAAYFTRVYNPVWTNPDGMMWERMLRDEEKVALHAALTPVWNETAQYADYVLPMGNAAERHDLMSQETHAAKWISFRQPVTRVAMERAGKKVEATHEANPGEVWEEDEFWVELSWRIDPDGSLGIRQHFESPYRPGEKITVDEHYRWIFENSVPGLPEEAERHGLTPLQYMKKFGAFLVKGDAYGSFKDEAPQDAMQGAVVGEDGSIKREGQIVAVQAGGPKRGFGTPSKRLELYSPTLHDWGWSEYDLPTTIDSHVHQSKMDLEMHEVVLVPTFRLPTLIHTRSANAKWLYELSNTNPVWMHPSLAERHEVKTGDLVRVTTEIGYFVNRAWVTEAIRPGIIACSHHLGRWRLFDDVGTDKWASAKVVREEVRPGVFKFRRVEGVKPFKSDDPDSGRVWWSDGGVHQNLTFPVQPDPVSGQHCWHQKVTLAKAGQDDRYGDVFVDTNKSMAVYRRWLEMARPAPGPGGLRRPLWLARSVRPSDGAYRLNLSGS
ncbi:MAG TPA: molybdopterin dinucleotide binding domain-containing protein [Fimbriimonadaceae bacterium]|nr:molybdopterin dinucleotide binding domain-containing protein [Fimbriimonadaceae bacterium]